MLRAVALVVGLCAVFGLVLYVYYSGDTVRTTEWPTASTQFVRTIGGTIGVAVMGTILNAQMAERFTPILARFASVG